ncbi:MAG: hypothetical protein JXD23_08940 [Spirochaetales bacterium]|nr:hypothetical protein [Spirochaetales bacterium]
MMGNRLFNRVQSAFFSPLTLGAIGLMFLNDQLLKWVHILPGFLTGKLSDVAFLFFAPIVLAYLLRAGSRFRLFIAFVLPAVLFTAVNCLPELSRILAGGLSLFIPSRLWCDPLDLIALPVMPFSLAFILTRRPAAPTLSSPRTRLAEIALLASTSFVCVATSPAPPVLYEPVYMSWNDFRSAVKVLPPESIGRRGKIYVKGDYLYVSEPNRGIHVIDVRDPARPAARAFFRVPGNLDVAVKGSALYADSFTDLLVFCLAQEPEDSFLVRRIENVFPYDPGQTLGEGEFMSNTRNVEKNKGVVIAWRQIMEDPWKEGRR